MPRCRSLISAAIAAMLAAPCLAAPAHAQERQELIIATTGGIWEKQVRQHFFDPFEKATGIRVVSVSASGADQIARTKAMVEAGRVTWDIYTSGEIQAASKLHAQLNENMGEFCTAYAGRSDLLPGACNDNGVLSAYGTTLMVYNAGKFSGRKPSTWADFWNVKEFPGPRALPNFNDPWRVLAVALLADGVPLDQLFPLDIDRAFRKMDEIKPQIGLWWRSGDQSVQGFRTGEYVMGMIWQTRASALKAEGLPLAWSLDQAVLVGDRWSIIKGAPNRENARKFLAFYLDSVEAQAKWCEVAFCTPGSRKAAEMMNAQARESLPLAPGVFEHLVKPDAAWINDNHARLLERWNRWIQQ